MTTRLLVGLGALLALAACTSSPTGPSSTTAAGPATTTTTTTAAPTTGDAQAMASAATVDACLSLVESDELNAFWETVPKGTEVTAPFPVGGDVLLAVRGGLRAVFALEQAVTPDVSPEVAAPMLDAVSAAGAMSDTLASTGMFDTRQMTAALSPVVSACIDAGVDMGGGS